MSSATPNYEDQPDVDRYPEDVSKNDAVSRRRSRAPWILAALLGVLALFGAVVLIPWGGGDGQGDDQNTSGSLEVFEDGYVDDSGQQVQEIAPVLQEHDEIEEIALKLDIGIAPVDMVGLTAEGALVPPEDVNRLGWYASSAIPGDASSKGSTVITGHVNHQTQGQGFAYHFTQLEAGDEVSVLIDGTPHIYRVTKPPFRVAKGGELPEEVNDSTGANKLVLITCGGEFVGGALGYADNVFVVAEPV